MFSDGLVHRGASFDIVEPAAGNMDTNCNRRSVLSELHSHDEPC